MKIAFYIKDGILYEKLVEDNYALVYPGREWIPADCDMYGVNELLDQPAATVKLFEEGAYKVRRTPCEVAQAIVTEHVRVNGYRKRSHE